MSHPRKAIRKAVAAQLVGATMAGSRVFETRMVPYRRTELPALAVYALEESSEADLSTAPRQLDRVLQLAVEAAVQVSGNADDAVDDLAWEIETALHADSTFGDTAGDSILTSTELEILEDGDRTVGVVRLTYEVTYHTFAPEEASGLDDLRTADIRYSLGGTVHPDDQANDVVKFPEE